MSTERLESFNWKKTRKALSQELRGGPFADRAEHAINHLLPLLALCGEGSWNRRAALRIARALVPERPLILAPCCPDYGHDDGRYTFHGLGEGVSLLAERHIAFLERVAPVIPTAEIRLLLADQEVDDEEILRAVGVDAAEFRIRMDASLAATRERVAAHGWDVQFMTHAIPDLRQSEAAHASRIAENRSLDPRVTTETIQRQPLYQRVNRFMPLPEMRRRTIRTAAQYLAMGHYAAERNALVCNHTTTNLAWYAETSAAILHNPISVY